MPRRGHHQEKIIRALKQADARVNGGESCREHGIRIEETYVRVKGKWRYLYRAIDSTGATIDFLLSTNRDAEAARRFLAKALAGTTLPTPRLINTGKHAAYPLAVARASTLDDVMGNVGVTSRTLLG